jgi:ABC-type branched-subunit amino acid transport system substrate-binding protein
MMRTGLSRVLAIACSGMLTVAACSSDSSAPTSTPAAVTDDTSDDATRGSSVVTVDEADEKLVIGVLLPLTGAGSEIGAAMSDAVDVALADARASDATLPRIELVRVDESSLEGAIAPTLDEIFPSDVDAIIGPASSLLAARLLPVTVASGVLTCSPTASALGLDGFPDPSQLFIRTIPSDSLQAVALARQLDTNGVDIVLAYADDAYGQPFVEIVERELDRLSATVSGAIAFDPLESDYTSVARQILASGAPTIGIIGGPEAGPRLVQSLAEQIDPTVQAIWMNDAMRVPATASIYRRLDPSMLTIMHGVSPRSQIVGTTPELPEGGQFFTANAFDCMNVILLAADRADVLNGPGLARQVIRVTAGGTPCRSFTACIAALRTGREIDYDGPSGTLDIGRDGDPINGVFDVFGFDATGVDQNDPTRSVNT